MKFNEMKFCTTSIGAGHIIFEVLRRRWWPVGCLLLGRGVSHSSPKNEEPKDAATRATFLFVLFRVLSQMQLDLINGGGRKKKKQIQKVGSKRDDAIAAVHSCVRSLPWVLLK